MELSSGEDGESRLKIELWSVSNSFERPVLVVNIKATDGKRGWEISGGEVSCERESYESKALKSLL